MPQVTQISLRFKLFQTFTANQFKIAHSIAFEDKFEDFTYKIIQFFTLFQIVKFIAGGTGYNVFAHGTFFYFTTSIHRFFTVAALAFLLFKCAAFGTNQTTISYYRFAGHYRILLSQ
jgi:hypothetical protein